MENITNTTFELTFFLKKPSKKNLGEKSIYARITINGKRKNFSIHRSIEPSKWKKGLSIGLKKEDKLLNTYLKTVESSVMHHHQQLILSGKFLTSEALRDAYLGVQSKGHYLVETFRADNARMLELVEEGLCAKATQGRYNTICNQTVKFIKFKFNKDDMDFRELRPEFLTDMEHWYKTKQGIAHNTARKNLFRVKNIVNIAVSKEWINRSPFAEFSMTLKKVNTTYLLDHEIKTIMNKNFSTERMTIVRDLFVFCCFTGLAFIEAYNLTPSDVTLGIDGKKWINTTRQKTGTRNEERSTSNMPLFAPVLAIINRYKNHSACIKRGSLLPMRSNAKLNEYLKELATLCGINKKLTWHVARHTFATFCLSNGVPIETVSKMLGHSSLTTTQHYAKVIDTKVSKDMGELMKYVDKMAKTG